MRLDTINTSFGRATTERKGTPPPFPINHFDVIEAVALHKSKYLNDEIDTPLSEQAGEIQFGRIAYEARKQGVKMTWAQLYRYVHKGQIEGIKVSQKLGDVIDYLDQRLDYPRVSSLATQADYEALYAPREVSEEHGRNAKLADPVFNRWADAIDNLFSEKGSRTLQKNTRLTLVTR